jgi:ankyrin repeat protein
VGANPNASVNPQNKLGQTPLWLAVKKHQLKLIRLLLDHALAIDTTDNEGNAALFLAAKAGDRETVTLLLQ